MYMFGYLLILINVNIIEVVSSFCLDHLKIIIIKIQSFVELRRGGLASRSFGQCPVGSVPKMV